MDDIIVSAKDIDPSVLQLSLAAGLLQRTDPTSQDYTVSTAWFSDPVRHTGMALAANESALPGLLCHLIGANTGSAMNIPAQSPGRLGTWYPLATGPDKTTATAPVCGPCLVSSPAASGGTMLGLGFTTERQVAAASEDETDLTVRLWGILPAVILNNGITAALADSDQGILLGIELAATTGTLASGGGLSLSGVRLSADLTPSATSAPVAVSIDVLGLQLPGQTAPANISLTTLTGKDQIDAIRGLITVALARVLGKAAPQLGALAPLLGFGGQVGTFGSVPPLNWLGLIAAARNNTVTTLFTDWLRKIAGTPSTLRAWGAAFGMLACGSATPQVSGSGNTGDPITVPLVRLGDTDKAPSYGLALTLASSVDKGGTCHFMPGLSLSIKPMALGTASQMTLGADLTLADLALGSTRTSATLAPCTAGITLSSTTSGQALFTATVDGQTYTVGSLYAGLEVSLSGTGGQMLPRFDLTDVSVGGSTHATVNLLRPDAVAAMADAALGSAVSSALNTLLDSSTDGPGRALAALLGLTSPTRTADSDNWPESLAPPLAGSSLADNIAAPVEALKTWYGALLTSTETVDDVAPAGWLVAMLGTLLSTGGAGCAAPTGSGTDADPWLVPIGSSDTTANLRATASGALGAPTGLVLGLAVATPVPPDRSSSLSLSIGLDALSLETSGTPAVLSIGTAFPGFDVVLSLPSGVSAPFGSEATLSVTNALASVAWQRAGGWSWTLAAGTPTLSRHGTTLATGESLCFDGTGSLSAQVTGSGAATFAPLLAGIAGLSLLRSGGRAGLLADGWLGLIGDLGSSMPAGISWPADMPTLAPTGFDDPLSQLRTQLSAILATSDKAAAAFGLLAWALDSTTTTAPPITVPAKGAPWRIPLPGAGGLDLAVLVGSGSDPVTLGLIHSLSPAPADGITPTIDLTLLAPALTGGAAVPTLSLTALLAGTDDDLIPNHLSSLKVGLTLSLTGDTPTITPTLIAQPADGSKAVGVTASEAAPSLSPAETTTLAELTNAGLTALCKAYGGNTSLTLLWSVLEGLGLAIQAAPAAGASDSPPIYGLSPGGWQHLTADPEGFLAGATETLLTDSAQWTSLQTLFSQVTGVTIPSLPAPLAGLLAGLGLITSRDGCALPVPHAILDVLANPITAMPARLSSLTGSPPLRATLANALADATVTASCGLVSLTATNGNRISLSLCDTITIGSLLQLGGTLSVDLAETSLSADLSITIPEIATTLTFGLTGQGAGPATLSAALALGQDTDGLTPVSLPLWPDDSTTFLSALADIGPLMVLTEAVGAALTTALQADPLATKIAGGLGLEVTDADGTPRISLPLQMVTDPAGWLQTRSVLGSDGKSFNITQVASFLGSLPTSTATSGLRLVSRAEGVAVTGLPYGLELAVTAVETVGDPESSQIVLAPSIGNLPLSDGLSLTNLDLGLTLSPAFLPGATAALTLGGTLPAGSTSFRVIAGYNNGFTLSLSQGDEAPLQLLPFQGWTGFATRLAGKVVRSLVTDLTGQLLARLQGTGAGSFTKTLTEAAANLDVASLMSSLVQAYDASGTVDASAMETAAWAWLKPQLTTTPSQVAEAVASVLSGAISGVSSSGGFVCFTPPGACPVTVKVGSNGTTAGVWLSATLKLDEALSLTLAPSGVGIDLTSGAPAFLTGLTVAASLDGTAGPALCLTCASGNAPTLTFDPLGGGESGSDLAAELMPTPFPGEGGLTGWLTQLTLHALPRYAASTLLSSAGVKSWLADGLADGKLPAPGPVLAAAGVLTQSGEAYALASPASLKTLGTGPFLGKLVLALFTKTTTLVSFTDGGRLTVGPGTNNGTCVLDLQLPSCGPDSSRYQLQIGSSTATQWIDLAGGTAKQINPGLSLSLPIGDDGPDFSALSVAATNVGVSLQGDGGKPVFSLSGVSLKAVAAYGLLNLDFASSDPLSSFGGGVVLEQLAFSVSPATVGGTSANPVAQSLLGSGSAGGDDPSSGTPPANPAYSATIGWLSDGRLGADFDTSQGQTDAVWMRIQRAFGPLQVGALGAEWNGADKELGLLFDGGLKTSGLDLQVIGLDVTIPVTDPTDYDQYGLDLAGLALNFSGGSVSLSGSLLKQEDPLAYNGELNATAGSLAFDAVGSYALLPGSDSSPAGNAPDGQATSMFAFADLQGKLGGPPSFTLQGLAGGFSINRGIILPAASAVTSFPLIKAVADPGYIASGSSPGQALAKLSTVMPPQIGANWAAAGLNVSTYQLVDSLALLIVRFGTSFAIDAIGLARATLPPDQSRSDALAYVELGLTMSFDPDQGLFALTGQLSPSSFVLSHACHLTGGFAVRAWFGSNPNAGDFVITFGGYSPWFSAPASYPQVPRVGFHWHVSDDVTVTGGAYFALTPSCVMAGGNLDAQFHSGPLKAWFKAGADFLAAWKPFYYHAKVSVEVGVSFTTRLLFGIKVTLRASLGAYLELYGPPTGGKVHVHWYVISFTIPFGASESTKPASTITWDSFALRFLPQVTHPGYKTAQPLLLTIPVGKTSTGAQPLTVRRAPLTLRVQSAIPASKITLFGSGPTFSTTAPLGIRPTGSSDITSGMTITLKICVVDPQTKVQSWQTVSLSGPGFTCTDLRDGAASALWSPIKISASEAATTIIPDALFGAEIAMTVAEPTYGIGPVNLKDAFGYVAAKPIPLPLAAIASPSPAPALSQTSAFATLMNTVTDASVTSARTAIATGLQNAGLSAITAPNLSVTASYADRILSAAPQLVTMGTDVGAAPVASTTAPGTGTGTGTDCAASGSTGPLADTDMLAAAMLPTPRDHAPGSSPVLLGQGRCLIAGGTIRARDGLPAHQRTRWLWSAPRAATRPTEATVLPGRVALFDAGSGPGTARLTLDIDQTYPVRIIALDRVDRVLQDAIYPGGTAVTLPHSSVRIAALCLPPTNAPANSPPSAQLTGWTIESRWLSVAPTRLVAPGCRVFSRGTLPLGTPFSDGPLAPSAVLAADRLETTSGTQIPGLVETVFPQGAATVAVILSSADRDTPVDIMVAAVPGENRSPVTTLERGNRTILLLAGAVDQPVAVRVAALDGLAGVLASDAAAGHLAEHWDDMTVTTDAVPASTAAIGMLRICRISDDDVTSAT